MLRVGLTGGMGCGKSTVAELFAAHGAPIIDTDVIARTLVEPGTPLLTTIIQHFGQAYLCADDTLDRAALGKHVFLHPEAKAQLEALLHPAIREEVARQLNTVKFAYAVIVVPLLFETGFVTLVDRTLVVYCEASQQLARVMARDARSAAQIQQIIAAQLPSAQRLARADDVISNTTTTDELAAVVARLHQRYLALATRSQDPAPTSRPA